MTNPEPSDEDVAQAVFNFVAEQMESGASAPQIQAMLLEKGLDQDTAAAIVANCTRLRSEAISEAGQKDMVFGALWCIGGIVVTVATYGAAASGGGTYIVAWGAIVFGAIQFFRGLATQEPPDTTQVDHYIEVPEPASSIPAAEEAVHQAELESSAEPSWAAEGRYAAIVLVKVLAGIVAVGLLITVVAQFLGPNR